MLGEVLEKVGGNQGVCIELLSDNLLLGVSIILCKYSFLSLHSLSIEL